MNDSSWIKHHTYDPVALELILHLHDKSKLRVPDVTREHYNNFLNHRSQGSYFNVHFKHKAVPHGKAQ